MRLNPPVSEGEFARLMAAVGPFEPAPGIAVGVSGGPDSMALLILLHAWAKARQGRVLALTVDHGLRAESATEAERVAGWAARLGIGHQVLTWQGPKPHSGVQAGARVARLRLLAEATEAAGMLHLALAHHADDQRETGALRAARGSGPAGQAGMPTIRELPALRLIRPLLSVTKDRLIATCGDAGQEWVDDPSNRNPRFARARLRLEGAGGDPVPLHQAAQARAVQDAALASLAARTVRFQAEGWALLDRTALLAGRADLLAPLLSTLLRAVGGQPYPPPAGAVAHLLERLRSDPAHGATLGGCSLSACARGWRVMREARNLPAPVMLPPRGRLVWDDRFLLVSGADRPLRVAPLDDALWRQAKVAFPELAAQSWPASVRRTLPVLTDQGEICAIPHLNPSAGERAGICCHVRLRMPVSAFGPRFAVVTGTDDII